MTLRYIRRLTRSWAEQGEDTIRPPHAGIQLVIDRTNDSIELYWPGGALSGGQHACLQIAEPGRKVWLTEPTNDRFYGILNCGTAIKS
jgi:hypothetical protein